MIKIVSKSGRFCPIITCGICGGQIESPDCGHVDFEYDCKADQVLQIKFVHKKCSMSHWGTRSTFWMPLEKFFEYLLFNTFHWGTIYIGGDSLVQQERKYYSLNQMSYHTSGVYLVHSQEKIVYIGQSKDVRSRLSNPKHPVVKAGVQVDEITVLPIGELEQRLEVEAMLISTLQPLLNQRRRIRLVV